MRRRQRASHPVAAALLVLAWAGPQAALRAQTPARPGAADNAAGVELRVAPDKVPVGASFAFKVTARQGGYLVILDVNADGAVTQLYPNVFSMKIAAQAAPGGGDPCDQPSANTLSSFGLEAGGNLKSNRLEAGQAFELPGQREGAAYAFQACPPKGPGMVLAVLSDQPVQIIDLPDIPAVAVGQPIGVERLVTALKALRLVASDPGGGGAALAQWSVAWAPYTIR